METLAAFFFCDEPDHPLRWQFEYDDHSVMQGCFVLEILPLLKMSFDDSTKKMTQEGDLTEWDVKVPCEYGS